MSDALFVQTQGKNPILPGECLGVMGGGQLGRMFVHAAQALGYHTVVLDPEANGPAGQASDAQIVSGYDNEQGLAELTQAVAAITTEFENVPAQAFEALSQNTRVAPPAAAIAIAQDRVAEKLHFQRHGVPVAPFAVVDSQESLTKVSAQLFPGILKTSRLGYDGKGQVQVANLQELQQAWDSLKQVPCVLEKRMALDFEVSVVLARGFDGSIVNLPVQRNIHHNGILATTLVLPGSIDADVQEQAVLVAKSIAAATDYVGVLCVEFFVLKDGQVIANEMAPRPHNSGHYSMDACDISQFELQVRTLASLPLLQPRLHSPAIMLNILGDLWFKDGAQTATTPDWAAALANPGVHLHLYGKHEARKGRKMGHITITGPNSEATLKNALKVAQILGLPEDFAELGA